MSGLGSRVSHGVRVSIVLGLALSTIALARPPATAAGLMLSGIDQYPFSETGVSSSEPFAELNGTVYFSGADSRSTGPGIFGFNADGEISRLDIPPLSKATILERPGEILVVGAVLSESDGPDPFHVYRYDGTTVTELGSLGFPYAATDGAITAFGNKLALTAYDSTYGHELRVYDLDDWGAPYTVDVEPGPTGGGVGQPVAFDGRVYFLAAPGGVSPRRLVSTDGTTAVDASGFRIEEAPNYQITQMRVVAGELLVNGWDTNSYPQGQYLWAFSDSSGASGSVRQVPSAFEADPFLERAVVFGDTVVFPGFSNRGSLYSYDGSSVSVIDVGPNSLDYSPIGAVNGNLLLSREDPGRAREPYLWDGSTLTAMDELVVGAAPGLKVVWGDSTSKPLEFAGQLLVQGFDADGLEILYSFDGTTLEPLTAGDPNAVSRFGSLTPLNDNAIAFTNAVYNSSLNSYEQSLGILRLSTNQSPAVVVTSAPASASEGSPFEVSAEVSDPDGDPLDVAWQVDAAGATCQVTPATGTATPPAGGSATVTASVTCDDQTDVTVTATVDDGTAQVSDDTTVSVTNVAPTIGATSLSSTNIDPGGSVTATANVSDPGNDTVTCTFTWGDPVIYTTTATATGGQCSSALTLPNAGTYSVRVTADDGEGGTSSRANLGTVNVVDKSLFISTTTTTTFTSPTGAIIGNQTYSGRGTVTIAKIGPTATGYTGKWSFYVGKSASPEAKFVSTSITSMEVNTTTGYAFIRGFGTYTKKPGAPEAGRLFFLFIKANATTPDQFRARIMRCDNATCTETTRLYDNDASGDRYNPPVITKGNIAITNN